MEEIDSGSSLPKMIGEILTSKAMLGGVEVECLVGVQVPRQDRTRD